MRTTVDLEEPILRDLKRLQKKEGKSLGELISELVASGLAARRAGQGQPPRFEWISRPLEARVDIGDRDALFAALDRESSKARR